MRQFLHIQKMATEQQFKRNIAYKLKIGDILIGKPILNQEKFQFLELENKKIVRVNVIEILLINTKVKVRRNISF